MQSKGERGLSSSLLLIQGSTSTPVQHPRRLLCSQPPRLYDCTYTGVLLILQELCNTLWCGRRLLGTIRLARPRALAPDPQADLRFPYDSGMLCTLSDTRRTRRLSGACCLL